jgi:hypothetical protein
MFSVNLDYQFLHIYNVVRRFPASPYVSVTRKLYEILELPVPSTRVEHPVHFPFVGVIVARPLRFRCLLAGGRRCLVVEQ